MVKYNVTFCNFPNLGNFCNWQFILINYQILMFKQGIVTILVKNLTN